MRSGYLCRPGATQLPKAPGPMTAGGNMAIEEGMDRADVLFIGLVLTGGCLFIAAWSWFMVANRNSAMGPPLSVPNVKRAAGFTAVAMAALGLTLLCAAVLVA